MEQKYLFQVQHRVATNYGCWIADKLITGAGGTKQHYLVPRPDHVQRLDTQSDGVKWAWTLRPSRTSVDDYDDGSENQEFVGLPPQFVPPRGEL
ncbi:hypothetical protein GWI33_015117 [Rhynchophorus ferrugineus]|uniref:Uncharacterized protein n=1 Tax=Rhynchophorus ferrugineus TaxID=354439 RepID=A0A834I5N3_RHYFE|nr:hypothetical protein GWI33_015117 [Rhynchophorus ferrugineus]